MNKKIQKQQVIPIMVLLIFTLFICMQSELAPLSNGFSGTDSSVFRYVARLMGEGKVPYKDTFDHKGPLIYFINYLGQMIHTNRGVWFVEVMFLFVGMLFSYFTANLFAGKAVSVLSVLTAYALLGDCYKGGNLTEEYALSFIAVGLFYFIKYLQQGEIRKREILIEGCCFGAVCMLRVNMIAVWAAFIPVLLIEMISRKKWDMLKQSILYFLLGTVAVIAPMCIYLLANQAFADFWNCYIVFNFKYSGNYTLIQRLECYEFFVMQPMIYLAAAGLIYAGYAGWKKNEEWTQINGFVYWGSVAAILINFPLMCMSGRQEIHYEMIMIGLLVLPVCFFYKAMSKKEGNMLTSHSFFVDFCVVIAVVLPLCANIWTRNIEQNRYLETSYKEWRLWEVRKAVNTYCDEKDTISVFGNKDILYTLCNRSSASRYSYQFPIADVDEQIYVDYLAELEENEPKLIVIEQYSESHHGEFREWLSENQYQAVDADELIFVKMQ